MAWIRGSTATLVVLVLPLALQGSAGAAPSKGPSNLEGSHLPGVGPSVVVAGGESRSVGGAPIQPREALQGRDPLLATRTLIEGHWGVQLPDGRALHGQDNGSHEISRLGLPVGDLTGDGVPDAISYEVASPVDIFSDDYRYAVHALDATDGAVLWSREYGERFDVLPIAGPDLTGDGRADIVVLTYDAEGQRVDPCNSAFCIVVEEEQHRWALEILSGANGATAWSRELEGAHGSASVALANIPPNLLTSDYLHLTQAAAVLPVVSGDHDGDGTPDLVLNEFDQIRTGGVKYYRTGAATVFSQRHDTLLATRALVLDGQTGGVLFQRTRDFTQGDAMLLPAGDAVGGGAGDLLWQAETETSSLSVCHETPAGEDCAGIASSILDLEMIDGQSLASGWTTTIDRDGLIWPFAETPRADLTGDQRADVLLFEGLDEGDDYPGWSMGVISGATGAVVWRKPTQDYPNAVDRTLIGEVGGGGGSDLLDLDLVLDAPAQTFNWTLRRIDGATGDVLLVTERVISAQEGYILSPVSDMDADGVPDIVLDHITRFQDEAGKFQTRSAVSLESGRTGEPFFTRTESGEAIPLDGGDLDGDGTPDLVLYSAEAGMQLVGLKAVSVPDGRTLWSVATTPASFDVRQIPDPSSQGGDLLLSRTRHTSGEHLSRVDALDGTNGSLLWGRGDAFALDLVCTGASCS